MCASRPIKWPTNNVRLLSTALARTGTTNSLARPQETLPAKQQQQQRPLPPLPARFRPVFYEADRARERERRASFVAQLKFVGRQRRERESQREETALLRDCSFRTLAFEQVRCSAQLETDCRIARRHSRPIPANAIKRCPQSSASSSSSKQREPVQKGEGRIK